MPAQKHSEGRNNQDWEGDIGVSGRASCSDRRVSSRTEYIEIQLVGHAWQRTSQLSQLPLPGRQHNHVFR